MADPSSVVGEVFTGSVKSYSPSKGYGFIVCDQVQGDMFFVHKNLPKEVLNRLKDGSDLKLVGKDVSFTLEISDDTGKPTASDISPLFDLPEPGPGAMWSREWSGKSGMPGPREMMWMMTCMKGSGKGKGKGKKGGSKGSRGKKWAEGTPMVDGRIQGTLKSFCYANKWGFAECDSSVGDFGDIFVHTNNIDGACKREASLRDGDVIEFALEDIDGKPVAKDIMICAQPGSSFLNQFMKGKVTKFNEKTGCGSINCMRIDGEVNFMKADKPASFDSACVDKTVMFKVANGPRKTTIAKFVNAIDGSMKESESEERMGEVIECLKTDGYLDDSAVQTLKYADPTEFLSVMPDLDLTKAENPSSFIQGALARQRKGEFMKGKGGMMAMMMDSWGWGKGGGWGKGPYY